MFYGEATILLGRGSGEAKAMGLSTSYKKPARTPFFQL